MQGSAGNWLVVFSLESWCFAWLEIGKTKLHPTYGNPRHSLIPDFTPCILDSRYWIMDSLSVELGIWITIVSEIQIPWSVFQIPKPRILDSTRNISHILDFKNKNFPDSESRFQGSPIGFFNPVIPIQSFVQSRNPDDCFASHLLSSYFQSQNSPYLCCKIPNPQFQIKGNLGSRKYYRVSLIPLHESYTTRNAGNSTFTPLLNKLFSKYFP